MIQPDTAYRPGILQQASRWLYTFLLVLVIPFVSFSLFLRGARQSGEHRQNQRERFGWVTPPAKPGGYLFHCVSVGEVMAASCLIQRLLELEPETPISVSTTTATGSARVKGLFAERVHHFYLPFDVPVFMAAMLKRVQPKLVLITEVELWPNLIHRCTKRRIPVMVVNARMTDRSARRYKKFPLLFEPMLQQLAHVCAQGQRDYDNYRFLGMDESRLTLTHNIKFDQAASLSSGSRPTTFLNLKAGQRPVLVGGSTHDPEERVLLEAAQSLRKCYPTLLLVLVPRHPERFNGVTRILEESGVTFARSSQISMVTEDCEVLLVDEMGKLNQLYPIATIAFVGGSLADRGGHNALEPAAAGVPILMGPHIYNNPEICACLQETGALTLIEDSDGIVRHCTRWLKSPQLASQTGAAGLQVLKENSGAVNRTLACIQQTRL